MRADFLSGPAARRNIQQRQGLDRTWRSSRCKPKRLVAGQKPPPDRPCAARNPLLSRDTKIFREM
jgi:hypothetical protein